MPNMPGMAVAGYDNNGPWTFIAGVSAARLGDYATAQKAEAQLRAMRERTDGGYGPAHNMPMS